jgi:hypothetical protein
VRLGTLTRSAERFLDASVAARLNILVAGGTRAGNPATSETAPIMPSKAGMPRVTARVPLG